MFADAGAGAGPDFDALVGHVKELQRNDLNAKEQWLAYTDLQGRGKRDPAKHTPDFLQGFLHQLNAGTNIKSLEDPILSAAVKHMQRASPNFKQFWSNFCAQNGGGFNDPMRHDMSYHTSFFDQLAQQASMALGMGVTPMASGGENPAKRMRDSSGMPHGTSGDSLKDALVNRLKAFQRSGIPQKELWSTYADMYLQGVRDPSRHDAATLHEFCANHNVPEAEAGGGSFSSMPMPTDPMGGCGGDPGGMPAFGDPGMPAFGDPGMPAFDASDPEKQDLVQRVKNWQKNNPENKEIWAQFCGPTRDPGRHERGTLQEFCIRQGI